MSNTPEQPIPIEIASPPDEKSVGTGTEGVISSDGRDFYIYSNGKWLRIPVSKF